jgi:hypothetical protein
MIKVNLVLYLEFSPFFLFPHKKPYKKNMVKNSYAHFEKQIHTINKQNHLTQK